MVEKRKADTNDEEEAFPRGGADVLTALEKRQIAEDARADFEADQKAGASGHGKGKRAKTGPQVGRLRL